jgi:hypothetical protein
VPHFEHGAVSGVVSVIGVCPYSGREVSAVLVSGMFAQPAVAAVRAAVSSVRRCIREVVGGRVIKCLAKSPAAAVLFLKVSDRQSMPWIDTTFINSVQDNILLELFTIKI